MLLQKEYRLDDVYGLSRDVPLNYVARRGVDGVLLRNLDRKKHITIFGSSKQGKTCLRKQCLSAEDYILVQCSNKWSLSDLNTNILKRAGYELTESTKISAGGKAKLIASIKAKFLPGEAGIGSELEANHSKEMVFSQLELDADDVNDIIAALKELHFGKYIVLEDFHYLRPEVQKDFAIELKAFHESSDLCFVITGVWLDENKLVIYNGDLTGRIIPVNADTWKPAELCQVVKNGAGMLNIVFDEKFVNELVEESLGNVYYVQEACHRVCDMANVQQTQKEAVVIGTGISAKSIIRDIVQEQSGRYSTFITNYGHGFQDTALEMHKWILSLLFNAKQEELINGLSYRSIRERLGKIHPRGKELNAGNVTQALKSVVSLQLAKSIQPIILDYDESNLILHIVDRGFIVWLNVQEKADLMAMIGL